MRKILTALTLGLSVALPSMGQVKTDTLYYDKNWKGVESKHFATYFRVIANSENSSFQKRFRDFYITGELQSEGGYISIDKYDDSQSIFDGEWINYYKSGKVEQKGYRIKGKQEGEYIRYKEDGLILLHAYFKNDKLEGIYTEFSEDGNICVQIEYKNGEPIHDYYIVSNQDGLCSKIRLSDKQPIYESPSLSEKKVEYKDGEAWPYYNKNGIMVGMTNNEVRDYGKYFQIPIIIANNSMHPIDFDPNNITAFLTDKKGNEQILKVYSAEEYMKKVRRSQNWAMALNGLAEGLAASSAGYSTSTTNSSYSGYSSSYGTASAFGSSGYAYGNYSGNSSYYGNSSSTTTSYNGAAAYQAQVIASNRIAAYDNALLSERVAKNEGYLKKTTIYPGETITGYINIGRKKGSTMTVNIDINGATYEFPWNISK
ncbi:hypothetical protein NXW31_15075 [Bacteroides fragilis]|nr:hypothetical protein [Bacteroides fragilis]